MHVCIEKQTSLNKTIVFEIGMRIDNARAISDVFVVALRVIHGKL